MLVVRLISGDVLHQPKLSPSSHTYSTCERLHVTQDISLYMNTCTRNTYLYETVHWYYRKLHVYLLRHIYMYMYTNIHIHVHIKSWVPVAHEVPTAIFCCCYVWGHHVHVQLVNIRVLNYSKTHVHVYSTCTCTYTHMCNGAHKFLHLPLSISCLYGMYSIIPYTSFPVSRPPPAAAPVT